MLTWAVISPQEVGEPREGIHTRTGAAVCSCSERSMRRSADTAGRDESFSVELGSLGESSDSLFERRASSMTDMGIRLVKSKT